MPEIKPEGKQIQEGIDIPGNIVSAIWSNCAWIHYVWAFLYTGQQISIFECTITFLYLQLNASTWEKKISGFPALFTMLSFKEERGNFVTIWMTAPPLCGHSFVSLLLKSTSFVLLCDPLWFFTSYIFIFVIPTCLALIRQWLWYIKEHVIIWFIIIINLILGIYKGELKFVRVCMAYRYHPKVSKRK